MKSILLFFVVALYMAELVVLIPVFMILQTITGKDLSRPWMVNWFHNFVERSSSKDGNENSSGLR